MYESWCGLAESPFRNALDVRWFHESPAHEEALARLFFLVEQRRRCGLLLGAEGTGKSLLLSVLARQLMRTQRAAAVVDLTGLGGDEVVWELSAVLGLGPAEREPSARIWRMLHDHLRGLQMGRQQTVLVFDHLDCARSDCGRVLERLLHFETGSPCGLTILAASRTGGRATLPAVLTEMADLRIELAPLDREQTAAYVTALMQRAGCPRRLFEVDAVDALFDRTGGVPRSINRLCDLALLAAMGEDRTTVDVETVETAADELLLPGDVRHERPVLASRF